MRRGPYKLYLDRDGDGVMPRSTFYRKLKKYQTAITQIDNQLTDQYHNNTLIEDSIITDRNDGNNLNSGDPIRDRYDNDNNINDGNLSPHIQPCVEILENNNIPTLRIPNESFITAVYQGNQFLINAEYNAWLDEEYDEQTQDQEIWFDAEDSWTEREEDFDAGHGDNFNQEQHYQSKADEDYHKPLCNCTTITRGEALLMTLLLGAEESLTWKTITAILSMINTLFQRDVVPASKYKLFKTLQLNEDILTYHVYCDGCFHYFGPQNKLEKKEIVCQNCNETENPPEVSHFLTFDISRQLKSVLENPEVQLFLIERFRSFQEGSFNNDIRSMRDGQLYKKLSTASGPLSNEYNFSYTFNTDGCQPSKSSKLSIWPIYVSINELSTKLQSKYMIMAGLWISKQEPDMQLFLQPFIDQANNLSKVGVQWKLEDQIIISKFIPLCAVVDSVARCKILNMKQYNGTYGCTFCEHPTKRVDNCQKYPISTIIPKNRTDKSLKALMTLAGKSEYANDIKGVWGPSPLINMNFFDIVDGMSPDYMHAILLGVVKQHTDILLSSFGKEYYVGNPNQIEIINKKLVSFKHPTCLTRSPRNITERDMWKATEWRSWLLFYSLICLKEILPQKYLQHLALLIEAMRILLSERIKYDELQTAGSLMIKYVALYQEYFGEQAMKYNVHLLLHIKKSVLNLGPLRCQNTFNFENENHFLLKLRKSPTHVCVQIARRYLFQKSLPLLKNKINISHGFLKFCERNLTGHLKHTFEVDGCLLIGKGKEYYLNPSERRILDKPEKCKSFNRFIYNRKRYTSTSYRICEKIDDSIVLFKTGKIGLIRNICYFDCNESEKIIYIFYEEVVRLKKYFHSSTSVVVHHIEECQITGNLNVCHFQMVSQPCMLTTVQNKNFIIDIPIGCYGD